MPKTASRSIGRRRSHPLIRQRTSPATPGGKRLDMIGSFWHAAENPLCRPSRGRPPKGFTRCGRSTMPIPSGTVRKGPGKRCSSGADSSGSKQGTVCANWVWKSRSSRFFPVSCPGRWISRERPFCRDRWRRWGFDSTWVKRRGKLFPGRTVWK